jgi:hypothetical protein
MVASSRYGLADLAAFPRWFRKFSIAQVESASFVFMVGESPELTSHGVEVVAGNKPR